MNEIACIRFEIGNNGRLEREKYNEEERVSAQSGKKYDVDEVFSLFLLLTEVRKKSNHTLGQPKLCELRHENGGILERPHQSNLFWRKKTGIQIKQVHITDCYADVGNDGCYNALPDNQAHGRDYLPAKYFICNTFKLYSQRKDILSQLSMNLLNQFLGKHKLQTFFNRLYSVALKGLNYGRASDYLHNGEARLMADLRHMITSPSAILFDVGANRGAFAKNLIRAWQGMNYELYAFEPSLKTFEFLKEALPDHTYVHLVNKGLGERSETVKLYSNAEGSGLASVYPRDLSHHQIDFSGSETIELTTLDIFCADHKISHIDFLKLDVEGHELAVLAGGKKMIGEGKVGIVQFEFGGCNIDSRTYFRDYYNFFKTDFNLFRVLSDGLQPIMVYSEKLEIFQSANYLAIRKQRG